MTGTGAVYPFKCLHLLSLSLSLSARHQFRAAEKTKNTAQQLDRTPTTVYKPRAQQKEYVSLLLCSVSDTGRLYSRYVIQEGDGWGTRLAKYE